MIHSTKGIVLRTVKYGETSLIVSIYTELFGLQSYLVNGVRTASRRGPAKANLFQPASLLDLVVYHQDMKNLQRLKEFKWGYIYQHLFFSITRNAVALYMVELLQKCLKQPEGNEHLFRFLENAFIQLDSSTDQVAANYPLLFAVQLASQLGLGMSGDFSVERTILDLREGIFERDPPLHPDFLPEPYSRITAQLVSVRTPEELGQIRLNQDMRRVLLHAYETFYAHHVPDFSRMKTLPVLQAIL